MYRLLENATKVDEEFAKRANFSMDSAGHLTASYADIVDAIHIVQTEMGITGTTAAEASTTVEGSIKTAQAAWENFTTALGDPDGDIDAAAENLVSSWKTVAENIGPVLETIGRHLGELFMELPTWVDALLVLVGAFAGLKVIGDVSSTLSFLPGAFAALGLSGPVGLAVAAVAALTAGLVALYNTNNEFRDWVDSTGEEINKIGQQANDALDALDEQINGPTIREKVQESFQGIGSFFDELWGKLDQNRQAFETVGQTASGTFEEIGSGQEKLGPLGEKFVELRENGTLTFTNIKEKCSTAWENMRTGEGILQTVSNAFAPLKEIGGQAWTWIAGKAKEAGNAFSEIGTKIGNLVSSAFNWGKDLIDNFVGGIKEKWGDFTGWIEKIGGTVKNNLGHSHPKEGPMADDYKWMPDMMDLFAQGIEQNKNKVIGALQGAAGDFQMALEPNMSMQVSATGSGSAQTVTNSPVTINVYGAEGQDVSELAQEIADIINLGVSRKRAVAM